MKKINKCITAIMMIITMLHLCSCNTEGITNDLIIRNTPNNQYNMVSNTYENGSIYTTYESGYNVAYFLDYSTMHSVPLCSKSDCTHKDTSCLSFQCLGENPIAVVYHNKIYWFESIVSIVDSKDGENTEAKIETICYCGDITTGESEEFVTIPDVCMDAAIQIVIVDDTLYIIGCESVYQEEDGSWTEISRIGNQYLYSINLNNADVYNYGLINDAPTANYNWTLNGVMFASVELSGVYKNKLYMSYRYVDDPSDIVNYVESHDDVDVDWSDADTAIPWRRVNKCLNLETNEIEFSNLPAAELIEDNTYIYYDNQFHVMDPNNNITTSQEIILDEDYQTTFVNGKLWKGSQNLCFDTVTGKDIKIKERFCDKNIAVLDFYNNKYIVQYIDDKNIIHFEAVPESYLLQG